MSVLFRYNFTLTVLRQRKFVCSSFIVHCPCSACEALNSYGVEHTSIFTPAKNTLDTDVSFSFLIRYLLLEKCVCDSNARTALCHFGTFSYCVLTLSLTNVHLPHVVPAAVNGSNWPFFYCGAQVKHFIMCLEISVLCECCRLIARPGEACLQATCSSL